jgi:hypothetical protein
VISDSDLTSIIPSKLQSLQSLDQVEQSVHHLPDFKLFFHFIDAQIKQQWFEIDLLLAFTKRRKRLIQVALLPFTQD